MKRPNYSHVTGIAALEGILQTSGAAKQTGHDPESIYCKWAYIIAEAQNMPMISVIKALAAFEDWNINPPAGLIAQARKLCMNKPDGTPY
jgi:hypothetical protein